MFSSIANALDGWDEDTDCRSTLGSGHAEVVFKSFVFLVGGVSCGCVHPDLSTRIIIKQISVSCHAIRSTLLPSTYTGEPST